jgi:DNA-binding SARP family transcriptional activator/WD40 repeat protein
MRIAVLGPLEVVTDDGLPVAVPGAKERLLLAILAAGVPGIVSVDHIVEALWNGDPPPSAAKSLQTHVVRLRTALEPDRPKGSTGRYVARRGPGYALAVGRDDLDSLRMGDLTALGRARLTGGHADEAVQLLTQATGLWRGEPYSDWMDAPFVEAERRRLAELRAAAQAGLLEARLLCGDHADVVPELERLVVEEPLREGWWRLLMLALYRSGRQADALAAGRRARALLADELGADPGPALRDMEAAILAQDRSLEVPAPRAGADPPIRAADADVLSEQRCPYLGLAAYQVADAPLFHGRQRLVAGLVARLVDAPLLAVSGPSGAGKSSVVRAGLLPALRDGALAGSTSWQPMVLTPGRAPVDSLAALTGEAPPSDPVLLVCDQFEELWGPETEPVERTAFLDAVLGLLDDGVVVRCVVVVRGDHLGRLAEHATFTERLRGALVLVPPLTDPELREIVREPARAVGLTVEPELLDAVTADGLGRPGALPLLSTALVGTWARRRGSLLTLAGYVETGGVAGALNRSAEEAYGSLDEEARKATRRLLVRLADVDDAGALVRRPASLSDLHLDANSTSREVVETLVRSRLLSVDGDRLEVTHEALLSEWPRLARWLDDDAAGRAVRRHLTPVARDWDRGGRPGEELYRGARLAAALEWAQGSDADLTPIEQQFLDASKARADAELHEAREQVARERRARRRTRNLATGLAALLVVALVATVLAVRFQRAADARATEAERLSLLHDADRLVALAGDAPAVDLSLLLAAQAVELDATPETEDALLGSLVRHQRAVAVVDGGEDLEHMALSGTGTLFLTTGGSVSTWPVRTEADGQESPDYLTSDDFPLVSAASPTDDRLVEAGRDFDGSGEADGMWMRILSAEGDVVPIGSAGELAADPLAVSFTQDGQRIHVLAGTGAGDERTAWNLTDFDVITGLRRDTGISGTLSGGTWPTADISDDGRTAVVYHRDRPAIPVLVDLVDGHQVPLQVPRRAAVGTGFRALRGGAAGLWADGAVTLYGADGRPVQQVTHRPAPVADVVIAPDGTWAATVGGEGTVTLWDVDRSAPHQWVERESFAGHTGDAEDAAVTSDGRVLITRGGDGQIVVWDVTAEGGWGTPLAGDSGRWLVGPIEVIEPDRLVVAVTAPAGGPAEFPGSVMTDLAATFLDPRTGRIVGQVELGEIEDPGLTGVAAPAVSPDGRMVAITTGLSTTVLDTRTFVKITTVRLPPDDDTGLDGRPLSADVVRCATWTPDSSRLLLCTDHFTVDGPVSQLVLVEPTSGEEQGRIRLLPGVIPDAAATSEDVVALADEGSGIVALIDAQTLRQQLVSVDAGDGPPELSFSDDGGKIAVVWGDRTLDVIDVRTHEPSREEIPPGSAFFGAEWLPDGRTLALAGSDGTVSLFDTDRQQLRARPFPVSPGGTAVDLGLVVDGTDHLVALSGNGPGRRWSLDPGDWAEQACAMAGRQLTRTEWAQYLPDRPYRPACSDQD